jgi:phenylpropionate dioxygenase-like ring-hydroxylating dioxygenase large terminal subunit
MAGTAQGSEFEHPDAINYQEILDRDEHPPPNFLRERSIRDLGTGPVPAAHFTDPALFKRQIERMWTRTWQMACREEEIPDVGDYHVYDIVGKSLIIARIAPDEFRALHNVCLHRGRKLVITDGSRMSFRCAFHGFTWRNDGEFLHNPMEWDFPQCAKETMRLPEAKIGRWGGFIFVNFDLDAPPLESILDPIPRHFERWGYAERYQAACVTKRIACNWLLCAEAFMEAHHSITTHPQLLAFLGDANAQHDVFSDYVNRHISSRGYPSPFSERTYTQTEIAQALLRQGGRSQLTAGPEGGKIKDVANARQFVASTMRKAIEQESGQDFSHATESELGDSLIYNVFPNLAVWGGFMPNLIYRWRPDGTRHDSALMEIRLLKPSPKDRPRPMAAKPRFLGEEEPWASATELGGLGAVVDQDWTNLPHVQAGLESGSIQNVNLGRYSEMRLRQMHITLESYLKD